MDGREPRRLRSGLVAPPDTRLGAAAGLRPPLPRKTIIIIELNPTFPAVGAPDRSLELGRQLGAVPGPSSTITSASMQLIVDGMGALILSSPYDADRLNRRLRARSRHPHHHAG